MANILLVNYATDCKKTRGRLVNEAECNMRTIYQRDRDRIIHSTAFRRLEYKTQVFINHAGDHYRTRLTHSLEVAQLARAMARQMQLDEDLAETIALAHDLGHPPFGHAGEAGLKQVMQQYGEFDHNAQALRVVTKLEQYYANFDGLNLTWETLEGLVKHNGALDLEKAHSIILQHEKLNPLEIQTNAGLEAQIAAISDDIAYNNHDIEDGIRAGFFKLEDLSFIEPIRVILLEVEKIYGNITNQQRKTHEVLRRLVNLMVADVTSQTSVNLAKFQPKSVEDIRANPKIMVEFSPMMELANGQIKKFLHEKMYRHYLVNRMTQRAIKVVQDLFEFFMRCPECLPNEWRDTFNQAPNDEGARVICDFIAGMTDRFALAEHKRIFNLYE